MATLPPEQAHGIPTEVQNNPTQDVLTGSLPNWQRKNLEHFRPQPVNEQVSDIQRNADRRTFP